MGLTNAERQARYRQRLKARASGADLGEQAQAAVDAGFVAVWAAYNRNTDTVGGGPDAFPDFAAYLRYFVGKPQDALAELESWLGDDPLAEPLPDELEAIERAAVIYRAAMLRHLPEEPKPTRSRKRAG